MELTDFQRRAAQALPGIALRMGESMAEHTSLRIGGPAEVMAFPKSAEELGKILEMSALWGLHPAILGAGTNVLAPDAGMGGLVICLKDGLEGMERIGPETLRFGAGVTMSRAAVFAAEQGLAGLAFAHGIPGTIGGGLYMNAGAYGGELGRLCLGAEIMDFSGRRFRMSREELDFSYRHSALQGRGKIVLSADFALTPGSREAIREEMRELLAKRSASQPLNLPSAGSAFKRPQGGYAAALIERSGLKGFRVGGAAISGKHAGFAVNAGGATAEDMKGLLRQVSDTVFRDSGIRLEPEIQIW